MKKYHVEYANKFRQIIEDNSEFAVRMLSLCQNQEEAELILTNKILSPKDDFLDGRLPFPILEGALINRNTKFVAHDYSQELLREKLVHSDANGDILPWNSTKITGQLLYMLMTFLLLPVFVLIKIVWDVAQFFSNGTGKSEIATKKHRFRFLYSFFSFPLNRSFGYLYSYILHFGIVCHVLVSGHKNGPLKHSLLWIYSLTAIFALVKNFR